MSLDGRRSRVGWVDTTPLRRQPLSQLSPFNRVLSLLNVAGGCSAPTGQVLFIAPVPISNLRHPSSVKSAGSEEPVLLPASPRGKPRGNRGSWCHLTECLLISAPTGRGGVISVQKRDTPQGVPQNHLVLWLSTYHRPERQRQQQRHRRGRAYPPPGSRWSARRKRWKRHFPGWNG